MERSRYYDNPDNLKSLESEALGWVDCPFHLCGESKSGVGCAGLQKRLHESTGAFPEGIELPKPASRYESARALSRMSDWLSRFDFVRRTAYPEVCEIMRGDMISYRIDVGELHLATAIGYYRIAGISVIQAIPHFGVSITSIQIPDFRLNILNRFEFLCR